MGVQSHGNGTAVAPAGSGRGRPPPLEESFVYNTLAELPRDAVRANVNIFAVIAGFQR
jgi:hypothetical protein